MGQEAARLHGHPLAGTQSEIEWDTVNEDDPRTWPNWEDDLKSGGLTQVECNRVLALVLEANALDEAKLQKAREVFLAGQEPMPARVLFAPHRTAEYAVWRACERLGIRPPGVKPSWDECGVEAQALIVAFEQVRSYDEAEREAQLAGARMPFGATRPSSQQGS